MVKNTCSDKNGLRKGTWTPEEDKKLTAYVTRYGHWNWNLLPKFAGLERCGKSCRLRWLNYLRPNIKRGNYTKEEDETIIKLLQSLGNRWSAIAAQLPGRTDNEIKNYWHTNLKKRYQQNSHKYFKTHESKDESPIEVPNNADVTFQNLAPISQSTDSCITEFSIATDRSVADVKEKFNIPENEFAFVDAYNYQEEPMDESFSLEPYLFDISCVPFETLMAEHHCLSPVRDVELWSYDNNEY